MSSFPRNSFTSSVAPQPSTRFPPNRDSQHASSGRYFPRSSARRDSERPSSNRHFGRSFSQLQGPKIAASAVCDAEASALALRDSSTMRRANTTAAALSRDPLARVGSAVDHYGRDNPYSRTAARTGAPDRLHRSNAVSFRGRSNTSSVHRSSFGTTAHNTPFPAAPAADLTRSHTFSTRNNPNPSTYNESTNEYGALMHSVRRPQAQPTRSGWSYSSNDNHLAHFNPDAASSHSSPHRSHSRREGNITVNITNINIRSNNIDHPHPRHGSGGGISSPGRGYGHGRYCDHGGRVIEVEDDDDSD